MEIWLKLFLLVCRTISKEPSKNRNSWLISQEDLKIEIVQCTAKIKNPKNQKINLSYRDILSNTDILNVFGSSLRLNFDASTVTKNQTNAIIPAHRWSLGGRAGGKCPGTQLFMGLPKFYYIMACRLAEWVTFLYAAVMATVVWCVEFETQPALPQAPLGRSAI